MRLAEIVLTFQWHTLLSRVMVPVRQVRRTWPVSGFSCTQNTKHPLWPVQNMCPCRVLKESGGTKQLNVSPTLSVSASDLKIYNQTQGELLAISVVKQTRLLQPQINCSLSLLSSLSKTCRPPILSPIHPPIHPLSLCSPATLQCRHSNNLRPSDQLRKAGR